MMTSVEVVSSIGDMYYYQIALIKDEKLRGYKELHRSEKDWGGHRQMIEGAKTELLEWLRHYLEKESLREGFEGFKLEHHPWYPGVKIETVCEAGQENASVRVLPGESRFLVFSHSPIESFASHTLLESWDPSPPPITQVWKSINERRSAGVRETCRGCGETFKEDNMYVCPHCGGEYCWRCKGTHIENCSARG